MDNPKPTNSRTRRGPTGRAVATNIRNLRIERGLTLQQVSDRSKESPTPLSLDALSKIENGLRRVDVDDLAVLTVILDASVTDLMHGNRQTRAQARLRELSALDAEILAFENFAQSRRKRLDMAVAEAEAELDPVEPNFEAEIISRWVSVTHDRPHPERQDTPADSTTADATNTRKRAKTK